ncbi:MAG TPA: M24 family metallopeptidase [Candidatus Binatia bacterium]|nr:M24 family metallopeptidase [Candidatus Binatia bacterium]
MIFGRHSVLKRGCSVWDRQAMPEEEYQGRLESVRKQMVQEGLDGLVIYGDNYSYADLCYLTNYFPKVRGGLGIIPRSGPLSLLLNIGSRDVPFAKSLTWVDDVRASGQLGRDGAQALKEKGLAQAKVGFMDSGKGFSLPELEELKESLPQVQWQSSHSMLQQMRLRKSPRELAALREACQVLNEICDEAREFIKPGRREYEIVADIDRLARDKGVEDIRILAGEKRLQPPSFKMAASVGHHWAAYLAIQHERYWAEVGRTYILSSESKLQSAYQKAQEIVAQMAIQLKPDNEVKAIDETARKQLGEFYRTAALYGLGNGIGLNQWEAPYLSEDEARQVGSASVGAVSLEPDMTLVLRVVLETEGKLVIFGNTYQVTPSEPRSLVDT